MIGLHVCFQVNIKPTRNHQMNKNIIVLGALMLGATSLCADEAAAPAGPSLAVTTTLAYDSMYVFRGFQYAESILSPAISASYGDIYGGLWFALPIRDAEYFYNEMDANLGYGHALSDTLKFDVGVTRYTYDDIPDDFFTDYSNSTEFYIGLATSLPLSPAIYLYRDIDYDVTTAEVRGSYSFELSKSVTLALSAAVGYVMPDDGDEYTYYNAAANLGYAINDSSSISGGVRFGGSSEEYIFGSVGDIDLSKNAIWLGMAYSTAF
jgi:uncharacterized protein (TIGR02001 family)